MSKLFPWQSKCPCRHVLKYTPAFADRIFPLKQAFGKLSWFISTSVFQGDFFFSGKHWVLFGGVPVCISSSWMQDSDNVCSFWKYILWLFLTSYINLLGNRMTPGHFMLLSWPFLLSKDLEFPRFYPLCTHPIHWSLFFASDDLLINKMCPVSLYNLDPQPKHHKAQ